MSWYIETLSPLNIKFKHTKKGNKVYLEKLTIDVTMCPIKAVYGITVFSLNPCHMLWS